MTLNLQAFAAASEHRNVTRICDEVDRPVDIRAVDALNREAEIMNGAREQINIHLHEIFPVQ